MSQIYVYVPFVTICAPGAAINVAGRFHCGYFFGKLLVEYLGWCTWHIPTISPPPPYI